VRRLCDVLTNSGLLLKENGHYRNAPTSALFLDPRSPARVASTARYLGTQEMQEPFQHLATIVRNGRTTLAGEGSVEPETPIWVEFAHSMAPMMAPWPLP